MDISGGIADGLSESEIRVDEVELLLFTAGVMRAGRSRLVDKSGGIADGFSESEIRVDEVE